MNHAADGELRGEPPTYPAEPRHPHSSKERVGYRHRPAIVDPRGEQDRCHILGERLDQRVGLVQQGEAKILEPADEHDIADDASKVYVVGPYRERLLVDLVHPFPGFAQRF